MINSDRPVHKLRSRSNGFAASRLSQRQREAVALLSQGLLDLEAAERFPPSAETAQTHRPPTSGSEVTNQARAVLWGIEDQQQTAQQIDPDRADRRTDSPDLTQTRRRHLKLLNKPEPSARLALDEENLRTRFLHLFGRSPSTEELNRFHRAHTGLLLGLPARTLRRVALISSRSDP